MHLRNVALAQLDRIDAADIGQLVHRIFQRDHADRLTGRADGAGAGAVHAGHFHVHPPVFPGVDEVGRLHHRLVEILAGQVGHQAVMAKTDQLAVRIRRQPNMLARFGSAHDRLEHLLAAQRHHHGLAEFPGRDGRRHGLCRNAELGAEAAPHERAEHADILRIDLQRIGQLVDIVIQHLIAAAQGQLVAFPAGDRTMRLHRGAVMARCAIDLIDHGHRLLHGRVQIALIELIVLRALMRHIGRFGIEHAIGGHIITHLQTMRAMPRLLEGLGNHQGDRLTEIGDLVRPLDRRFIGGALCRIAQETLIVEHAQHAGQLHDRILVDGRHLALGHGGAHQHAMDRTGQVPLMRIGGRAGDLFGAIGPVHRLAGKRLGQLIEHALGSGLVHHEVTCHAVSPIWVASRSTALNVRRRSRILKLLPPCPWASASSKSAASVNKASDGS